MFYLNKKKDKPFKILQLTDVQIIDPLQRCYNERLSESQVNKWLNVDECLFNDLRKLIDKENPDWIILTGDNVYGEFDLNGSAFINFVNFMESFKKPWSFVNGNHDGEMDVEYNGTMYHCGIGMKWQGEYIKNHTKYCMYELGDEKLGYGNYVVLLKEEDKTINSFIMMDTHGARNVENPGINPYQMEWYKKQIESINKDNNRIVDNLLFYHIPNYEYYLAATKLYNDQLCEITTDGSKNERGDFGANYERVSCFRNDEFWELVKSLKSTKAIFVGHDHINNTSIEYEGIRLTFGTKIGTYDYNRQQGATRIIINNDKFEINHILLPEKN